MTDSEIGFDIEMKEKGRQLQLHINKLITDFEQKYFNQGVRVKVELSESAEVLKEGGAVKLVVSTKNSQPVIDRKPNIIDATRK